MLGDKVAINYNINPIDIPYDTVLFGGKLKSSEWNSNFGTIETYLNSLVEVINSNFSELDGRLPTYSQNGGTLSIT